MNAAPKTLRHLSDLAAAGLTPADQRAALERVAAQYAVAITPAMAELIDPADPHDPIARQFVPDPAELNAQPRGIAPTRSATTPTARSKAWCIAIPTARCSSSPRSARCTAASASAARWSGRARSALTPQQLDAALAYIAAHPEIWEVILTGGDPLVLSPRRLQAGGGAACRDRARQGDPRAHPHPGRRARTHHAGAGARAEGARQGDLRGAARQPSARADRPQPARPARCWSTPAFRC